MNIKPLKYFVAVADHSNFHRAAQSLNVAQSAVSKQVSQLELEVGGALFKRSSRGAELTPLGQVFYTEAKYLIYRFENIVERTKSALAGEFGQLTLGVSDVGEHPLFARCVSRFHALYPSIELHFLKMRDEDLTKEIRAGRVDVGVVLHKPGSRSDLGHLALETATVMLALPEHHPLASHAVIDAKALEFQPFINVRPEGHRELFIEVSSHCAAAGLKPSYVTEAASERMQLWLIREGMGVGIVMSSSTVNMPPGIVARPIENLDLELEVDLIWLDDAASPRVQDFMNIAAEIANERKPARF